METVAAPISSTQIQHQFADVRAHLAERIIGQAALIDKLLVTLLCQGHLLVEGAPGLAKTTAIKALAEFIEGDFQRIQFTPDLLPGDLTGTDIFHPDKGAFSFQAGPLFHNIVLADEINRAPAKVQAALLEAMAENQITVGRTTYALPHLFMVMATQNPLEHEGTYNLPEAQLDRFLMYVTLDYPPPESESAILKLVRAQYHTQTQMPSRVKPLTQKVIQAAQFQCLEVHLSPPLEAYLIQLVMQTRKPSPWLRFGASPRATIGLDRAVRAYAWLQGRNFVTPEDIQTLAFDVLRHRIILSFEAQAEGVTADEVIKHIITEVAVP